MRKKWPEGVIVVSMDRYVEEEEYGFYWAWWRAKVGAFRVGKGTNDMFRPDAIYLKVDASTLDSPPPKPEPIEELEDCLYKVRKMNDHVVYREKEGDSALALDGSYKGAWSGYKVISKMVEVPID